MTGEDEQLGQSGQGRAKRLKATLLDSPEGRLLLTGVGMAFVYSFWLGVQFLFSPKVSQVLIGMTATELLFGRAAGMAFGYSSGLDYITVIPICMVIETIRLLIFYPLFVLSWQNLLVVKRLMNIFERIQKAAELNKGIVHKYGIIGLFVFVWLPFWMTGPVVGGVIGFMLGLKVWLNVSVVTIGSYAAILCWVFFLRQFHDQVAIYTSYTAVVMMGLLVIIIAIAYLMQRTLHERKH